jgi:hypothetical protein
MFFPCGISISTNTDSIISGSEKVHSGRNLYFKQSWIYRPVPPPVFELRWLETKLYPEMFTWSEVRSLSQVSDTPITRTPITLLLHSYYTYSYYTPITRLHNYYVRVCINIVIFVFCSSFVVHHLFKLSTDLDLSRHLEQFDILFVLSCWLFHEISIPWSLVREVSKTLFIFRQSFVIRSYLPCYSWYIVITWLDYSYRGYLNLQKDSELHL